MKSHNPILLYIEWASTPRLYKGSDKYWWAMQIVLMPLSFVLMVILIAYEDVTWNVG